MLEPLEEVKRHLEEIYQDPELKKAAAEITKPLEKNVLSDRGLVGILSVLNLMFLHPDLTFAIQLALLQTADSYAEAVKLRDPSKVNEILFAVHYHPRYGIVASEELNLPAAYDRRDTLPLPSIMAEEEDMKKTRSVGSIHTHPPSTDSILKPSGLVKYRSQLNGDLYALFFQRGIRADKLSQQGWSVFTTNPLDAIFQENLEKQIVKAVFYSESEWLRSLRPDQYLGHIKEVTKDLQAVKGQETVVPILRQAGYHAAYFETRRDLFYSYPPIEPLDLNMLALEISKPAGRVLRKPAWWKLW